RWRVAQMRKARTRVLPDPIHVRWRGWANVCCENKISHSIFVTVDGGRGSTAARDQRPRAEAASVLKMAKSKKKGQTKAQIDIESSGGSNESLADAEDQANEEKNQEATGGDSQAREESEAAGRQDGRRGGDEKGLRLAVLQRQPGARAASNCDPRARCREVPLSRWPLNARHGL
ncbi:MAG: hypothetical protein ACTS6J_15950, partial [Burkholderiales bacterium]